MSSGNVWIKNGTVRNLVADAGVTATGQGPFLYKDSPFATFQAILTGTGALSATIDIEYSNDGVNPCATVGGTITLSGTTLVSDGFASTAAWKYVRVNVTALSGTNATVKVLMGV